MTPAGMLNAVGLQGPGVTAWLERDLPRLQASGARVIASVWGRTVEEFARAAKLLHPARDALIAVEVNVSCPNLHEGTALFAHDPAATAAAVTAVVGTSIDVPVFAKLAPDVTDIVVIARAAVDAGATGLTLVNTIMGLLIDAVRDVTRALPAVPVIGTGGVMTGTDAVEMLLAGASAVGVGTATFLDPRAPFRVHDELIAWCAHHGVARVRDLVGAMEDRS